MGSAPTRPTGAAAGLLAAGSAVVLLLVVLGLARAVSLSSSDADGAAAPGQLTGAAYSVITLGIDEEALTERLSPARPVQVDAEGDAPGVTSEPFDGSCLFYEAAGRPAGDLYRFCFEDDRLVDKDVLSPDDPV